MNDHEARILTAWFDANEVRGSEASLGRALAAAKGTTQRPSWLVTLRGGTITSDEPRRTSLAVPLLAGSALIVALVTGALVGGLIGPSPSPLPVPPSLTPAPSSLPSPTLPAVVDVRRGLVAFTHVDQLERGVECPDRVSALCYEQRLWVANPDGSNAHALVPTVAGYEGSQIALGWSPDGRWLLFDANGVPTLTNASGSEVRPLDVRGDSFAFSPDSTRLAFVRDVTPTRGDDPRDLAILDLASGQVVAFESTRSREGLGGVQWSPDGAWIAYDRQDLFTLAKIFIIRPDGTGRRALTSDELPGIDPNWSPDGSSIAFTYSLLVGNETRRHIVNDIYTLELAGRDPVRLTDDEVSGRPSWTLDGRIVFIRSPEGDAPGGIELWVMNADGSGRERLDASTLAALSEIGCVVCIYPPTPPDSGISFDNEAFWQPTR